MTRHTTPTDQPRLLDAPVPLSLRLDARTRRVGLAGVANARALLAEQSYRRAQRDAARDEQRRHPPTPPASATGGGTPVAA